MNSAIVQQYDQTQPSYSAYVEELPSIPELSYWISHKWENSAQIQYTPNIESPTTTVVESGTIDELTHDEKLALVKQARNVIRDGVRDLDPDIRELVSKNFKNLLWK